MHPRHRGVRLDALEEAPMKILRTALVAAMVVSVATWPSLGGSYRLPGLAEATAYAATLSTAVHGPAVSNENEQRGREENRNGNNGNDNDENDNGNGNSSDQGSAPAAPSSVSSSTSSAPPAASSCSTPGQDMVFTSPDGRVTVRVFASMAQ